MQHGHSPWHWVELGAQFVTFGGLLLSQWARRGRPPTQHEFVSLLHAKTMEPEPHPRLLRLGGWMVLVGALLWMGLTISLPLP